MEDRKMSKKNEKKLFEGIHRSTLVDLIVHLAGGSVKAQKAFVSFRVASMVKDGASFEAMRAAAAKEGWSDSLTMDTLKKAMNGSNGVKKARKSSGPRVAKGDADKAVLGALSKDGQGVGAVVAAAKLSPGTVRAALARLIESGQVQKSGELRNTVYSLV
jgi:hypothetical protein